MNAARAVWLGPGAARALRPGRPGLVEVAHENGAYVRVGRHDYVHLCGPRAPRGPLSIALSRLPDVAPQWQVRVGADAMRVGPLLLSLTAAERATARAPRRGQGAEAAVAQAVSAARAELPPPPPEVVPGLALLAAGGVEAGATALAGLGEGLTPAGDDVLTGFAGWRAAAGHASALSGHVKGRSSPLGLAYLRCAERGELPDSADALLRTMTAGDAAGAARRARVLAGWGASSGAALYWGMHAAWIAAQPNVNE
jgi:hypothetical protein